MRRVVLVVGFAFVAAVAACTALWPERLAVNTPLVGMFLGAEPPPKRTAPRSAVAASVERTTCAGAEPPPKRTRRESVIRLLGLRTTGCFLLFM